MTNRATELAGCPNPYRPAHGPVPNNEAFKVESINDDMLRQISEGHDLSGRQLPRPL